MPSETAPAPKSRGWLRVLIAFVIAFDVAAFFQWADGAFQSEFGGHPDEAAHYLTGVRVRDAAMHARDLTREGGARHPIAALRRTPAFDVAEGGWMLVFGTSRIAVLLFMAALAAATTTLIFCAVRREFGDWAAAIASLLWLCAPAVRESYETILPEQFAAFFLTGAALLWARRMDDRATPRTAVSGWIRGTAVFGGGWVLAIAIASVISIFAMPFLKGSALSLGLGAAPFALAGVVIFRRSGARPAMTRFAMTSLVAAVIFARWMKASGPDIRVLIVATPALAMLAVHGAVSLAGIVGSRTAIAAELSRRRALWLFLLVLLALPADLLHPRQKDWSGFAAAALTLMDEAPGGTGVLVVSDPRGEGMLLSEIAMHDREGKITIERGSETLVESGGPEPRGRPLERFLDDEHLFAHLTSGRIRFIVFDSAVPQDMRAGYHDQVNRVIEGNVRSFWPIYDSPIIRDGEPQGHPLRIFRVAPSGETQLQLQ